MKLIFVPSCLSKKCMLSLSSSCFHNICSISCRRKIIYENDRKKIGHIFRLFSRARNYFSRNACCHSNYRSSPAHTHKHTHDIICFPFLYALPLNLKCIEQCFFTLEHNYKVAIQAMSSCYIRAKLDNFGNAWKYGACSKWSVIENILWNHFSLKFWNHNMRKVLLIVEISIKIFSQSFCLQCKMSTISYCY